jgi:hypothetical protein
MSRDQEATSGARVEVETTPKVEKAALKQAVKFAEPKDDDKPVGATKVCSGHLGKQLRGNTDVRILVHTGRTAPSCISP